VPGWVYCFQLGDAFKLGFSGLADPRRRAYMGHGARTMTELYETAEVDRWLVEDAAALGRVLGEPVGHLAVVREA